MPDTGTSLRSSECNLEGLLLWKSVEKNFNNMSDLNLSRLNNSTKLVPLKKAIIFFHLVVFSSKTLSVGF